MKNNFLTIRLTATLIFLPIFSIAQGFSWAQGFNSAFFGGATSTNNMTIDANNNILGMGFFSNTVDVDASANTYNLTAVGQVDAFLLKEDASGNFQWAKHFQCKHSGNFGIQNNEVAINVDAAGYIYIIGSFRDTVDFDPGSGFFYMGTPPNISHLFIVKLDPIGDFIWAKQIGGMNVNSSVSLRGMQMDETAMYISGIFGDTTDFDPNMDVTNLTPIGTPTAAFFIKLDTAGNFIWAKQINGIGLLGLGIDSTSNLYFTGVFNGAIDFDPSTNIANLTSSTINGDDIFVAKWDSTGSYQWAKSIGISSNSSIPIDITTDRWSNVLVTGYFGGTVDFDPGAGVYNLTSNSTRSIFTLKLRSNGDFAWARKAGGNTGLYQGNAIVADDLGNVYVASDIWGTTSYPTQKFDSSGNLLWTLATAGTNGYITLDNNNSIYLSGFFSGTQDFDPSQFGVYNLTGSNNSGFILKLCQNTYTTTLTLTALGDTVLCAGDTVLLTTPPISGATRYYWRHDSAYFTDTNTIAVGASGTYSVTVYGGECPLYSNIIHIIAYPAGNPSLSISTPPPALPGQTVTVSGTLAGPVVPPNIDWYLNGALFTSTNTFTPVVSFTKQPGNDTVYAVLRQQAKCYDTAVFSDTVIVSAIMGISQQLYNEGISVYPNPFEGFIKIDGLAKGDKISVADVTGRVLLTKEAVRQTEMIDTKHLVAGYYIIRLIGKDGSVKGNVPVVRR